MSHVVPVEEWWSTLTEWRSSTYWTPLKVTALIPFQHIYILSSLPSIVCITYPVTLAQLLVLLKHVLHSGWQSGYDILERVWEYGRLCQWEEGGYIVFKYKERRCIHVCTCVHKQLMYHITQNKKRCNARFIYPTTLHTGHSWPPTTLPPLPSCMYTSLQFMRSLSCTQLTMMGHSFSTKFTMSSTRSVPCRAWF